MFGTLRSIEDSTLQVPREIAEPIVKKLLSEPLQIHSSAHHLRGITTCDEGPLQALRSVLQGNPQLQSPWFTCADTGFEAFAKELHESKVITVLPSWLLDCAISSKVESAGDFAISEQRLQVLAAVRSSLGLRHLPRYKPISALQPQYEASTRSLKLQKLTAHEQHLFTGLKRLNDRISKSMQRELRVGLLEGLDVWTDGRTFISVSRQQLSTCSTPSGAVKTFLMLVQAYAHAGPTWLQDHNERLNLSLFHALSTDTELIQLATEISAHPKFLGRPDFQMSMPSARVIHQHHEHHGQVNAAQQ